MGREDLNSQDCLCAQYHMLKLTRVDAKDAEAERVLTFCPADTTQYRMHNKLTLRSLV